jgi:ribosomal protein L11 methyltransferase
MQWLEVAMTVDGEAAEAVAGVLSEYGYEGVSIEQEGIMAELWNDGDEVPVTQLTLRAYLPINDQTEETKMRLERALGMMNMMYPMPQPKYLVVDDQDWANAWKVHYHPLRLGKRLFIRPLWVTDVETNADDVVIALDPGMAFGTGTHPSTQLCLQATEDLIQHGAQVLDLGCGSGILAIAAAKLGAAHVLALDIDDVAVKVAIENIEQNGISDKITTQQGTLENVVTSARRFDLALVNILAHIIIKMCDQHLGDVVRPGGRAIFGGLTIEQADDVEAALRRTGLTPTARRQQADGQWVVIEAVRAAE